MGLFRNKRIVPALMFHSVGLENHPWVWSHISESLKSFESKIAFLRKKGFNAVTWGDLYSYMAGDKTLPQDSILLTYDDGYLDNWVFVYPILKRYGMKGTIFVNPEFVDPCETVRPTIENVWSGDLVREDLQVAGFLSWPEMRRMEEDGVMDIQSHTMSHTWFFKGPKIEQFYFPSGVEEHPWLAWNTRPERKPYYLTEDQTGFAPLGYPLFEHEKALIVRRFFPDADAVRTVTDHVKNKGGREYFNSSARMTELRDWVESRFGDTVFPGTYETEAEQEARIRTELTDSKRLIEQQLDKCVDFVCWPGGGNDKNVQACARDAGYKSWTLGSQDQSTKRNLPGEDPISIKRMSTDNRVAIGSKIYGSGGPLYQWLHIASHQKSGIHRILLRSYKVASMVLPWSNK